MGGDLKQLTETQGTSGTMPDRRSQGLRQWYTRSGYEASAKPVGRTGCRQ